MRFNCGKTGKERNKKPFPWGNPWYPFKKGLYSGIIETFNSQNIATSLHSIANPVLLSLTDVINITRGPGSSVGKATAYGLDGPGIESRWGRDFLHLSRLALRPTQLPVQWVPGLSRG
jgi:hypothetical protein